MDEVGIRSALIDALIQERSGNQFPDEADTTQILESTRRVKELIDAHRLTPDH
jgi:hypothetical protein